MVPAMCEKMFKPQQQRSVNTIMMQSSTQFIMCHAVKSLTEIYNTDWFAAWIAGLTPNR